MAVVEVTREQLSEAVRQLPKRERVAMITELLSDINGFPQGDEARKLFKKLRSTYRMDAADERRMSDLLAKGNDDKLTAKERRELDALLDESQERMLQLALAVMMTGAATHKNPQRRRSQA